MIARSVGRRALRREVVGLNLPAVPEVTLGGHSSGGLTIPRCKIETRPWQSELTLRIITCKPEQSTGNGASTLALKSIGRVQQSPKQQVPVAPQNGDLPPQNF